MNKTLVGMYKQDLLSAHYISGTAPTLTYSRDHGKQEHQWW
jgi:hypothetical protein